MDERLASRRVDPATVATLVRESYEMDLGEARAFLPGRVPLEELPPAFSPYLSACAELTARYPADKGGVRSWLNREFPRDEVSVQRAIGRLNAAERDRAMTVLSVLGHTFRWDCAPPAPARFQEQRIALPPGIAGPWAALALATGQPRVGTTWSLHLCNWTMTDRPGGSAYRTEELTTDNVRVAHNWLSPPYDGHLEYFSISFVLMEARGAAVLEHLVDTIEAATHGRRDDVLASLAGLHTAIKAMTLSFSSTVRKRTVDPAIWLELVQPTFAWSAETEESGTADRGPSRVEGGPSGMQVGTIQALDAALGVEGRSALAELALKGRRYMPARHRRFLETVELAGPVLRGFVHRSACGPLTEAFNKCVGDLSRFRSTHHARGAEYLRNRPSGDVARTSTGLVIGVDDDPMKTFECSMAERAAETDAAILSVGCQPA